MKRLVTIILLTTAFSSLSKTMPPLEQLEVEDDTINPIEKENPPDDMLRLFNAIVEHESMGGKILVGDNGKARGYAHLHKVMVDDVNRILGDSTYTYQDRMDRDKNFEMFCVFQNHYNPSFDIKTACMMWNAGVDCKPADKAERYYNKVMKFYLN